MGEGSDDRVERRDGPCTFFLKMALELLQLWQVVRYMYLSTHCNSAPPIRVGPSPHLTARKAANKQKPVMSEE